MSDDPNVITTHMFMPHGLRGLVCEAPVPSGPGIVHTNDRPSGVCWEPSERHRYHPTSPTITLRLAKALRSQMSPDYLEQPLALHSLECLTRRRAGAAYPCRCEPLRALLTEFDPALGAP